MLYAVVLATFIQGSTVRQQMDLKPVTQCTQRTLADMGAFVRVTSPGQMTAQSVQCETSTQVGLRLQAAAARGARITDQLGNITEWNYLE